MKLSFLYICYRFLSQSLAIPIVHIFLYFRLRKGKEIQGRLNERRGCPRENFQKIKGLSSSTATVPQNLIWIHAASVGEAMSILSFVDHLLANDPSCTVMVTTGTVASARIMDKKLPPRAFHQFIPVDLQPWVVRFLDFWQPKIVFWTESEFWPNFIHSIGSRQISLVMINGRMSERSFHRWQWARTLIKSMLQQFRLCLAQSPADAKRLQLLGATDVVEIENLKFVAQPLSYAPQALQELQQKLKHRSIWVAASTHEGEEEIVVTAHELLRKKVPNLLTILVPRHPDRGAILKERWQPTMNIAQRSLGAFVSSEIDLYLIDTLGELGLFYALAPLAFVGGSLVPMGGHNLIEPARLHCALLHGPYMFNCQDVCDVFHQSQAAIEVKSAQELADQIDSFFNLPDQCAEAAARAYQVVQTRQDVLSKLMTIINPLLVQSTS